MMEIKIFNKNKARQERVEGKKRCTVEETKISDKNQPQEKLCRGGAMAEAGQAFRRAAARDSKPFFVSC